MADKSVDLGVTTNDLQRHAIKKALAEELKDRRVLSDEVIAMIDEDERKIAELERLAKEKGFVNAYGNNVVRLSDGNPSDTAITITANVDEAVAGLKRLQRELRKTTQELRELESAYKDVGQVNKAPITRFDDEGNMSVEGANFRLGSSSSMFKASDRTFDLSKVPTYVLSEELARRAGVREYRINPEQRAVIHFSENDSRLDVDGPAVLLVNID